MIATVEAARSLMSSSTGKAPTAERNCSAGPELERWRRAQQCESHLNMGSRGPAASTNRGYPEPLLAALSRRSAHRLLDNGARDVVEVNPSLRRCIMLSSNAVMRRRAMDSDAARPGKHG